MKHLLMAAVLLSSLAACASPTKSSETPTGQDRGGAPVGKFMTRKSDKKLLGPSEKLLPFYSLGYSSLRCSGTIDPKTELYFTCIKDGTTLRPDCSVKFTRDGEGITAENKATMSKSLETTLEYALDFYFSENRVKALSKATKAENGWTTTPKNAENIVHVNSEMTKLDMPAQKYSMSLSELDGYLFITAVDTPSKTNATLRYVKTGKTYFPSVITLPASEGMPEFVVNIEKCRSK